MEAMRDGGGGDRRLRPHSLHQVAAVKCPRCDSLNTKFCYYNNYNLSQPRHFCKSCRRYWTKGGVLRNVPVGGGCRKNKRSKSSKTAAAGDSGIESKSRNKSSSSESSSLTAAAVSTAAAVEEEGSVPSNTRTSVRDFPDSRVFDGFDRQPAANHLPTGGTIFPAEIGGFAGLMASPEEVMGFAVGDIPLTASFEPVNPTPAVENPTPAAAATVPAETEFKVADVHDDGLAAALDWGDGIAGDAGRFDLTAGVDPSYWSQHQWTVNDQSLHYFP